MKKKNRDPFSGSSYDGESSRTAYMYDKTYDDLHLADQSKYEPKKLRNSSTSYRQYQRKANYAGLKADVADYQRPGKRAVASPLQEISPSITEKGYVQNSLNNVSTAEARRGMTHWANRERAAVDRIKATRYKNERDRSHVGVDPIIQQNLKAGRTPLQQQIKTTVASQPTRRTPKIVAVKKTTNFKTSRDLGKRIRRE